MIKYLTKFIKKQITLFLFYLLIPSEIFSQFHSEALTESHIFTDPYDKCGFNEALNTRMVEVFGYNWGY
ncbi:MAG: hypothetical protein EH225_09715, partial [Calditrichaeota bacterium]